MIQSQFFKVASIPLFNDNYSYALFSLKKFSERLNNNNQKIPCYLVDPADHSKIIDFLKLFPYLQVSRILYTHKHQDHIGHPQSLVDSLKQNERLMEDYRVISSKVDGSHIPTLTHSVFNNPPKNENDAPNETINEGDIQINCLYAPCHTTGHVLFHFQPKDTEIQTQQSKHFEREQEQGYNVYTVDECLFTGDTLFIGGCGRFFEGNGKQMLSNMDKIAQIPNKQVKIFCGHEYTKANLEWSTQVEKDNEKLQEWYKQVLQYSENGTQTIPSTLEKELETNLFMRSHTQNLKKLFQTDDPEKIMSTLRTMKNGNSANIPQSTL